LLGTYDAENVRLSAIHHQLELSIGIVGHLMPPVPGLSDRLFISSEWHRIQSMRVARADGEGYIDFALGGTDDSVLALGYAIEHATTDWLHLGLNLEARHVRVLEDSQRQVRVGSRAVFSLAQNHHLSLEAVFYYVHRNADQFGSPMPVHGSNTQGAVYYHLSLSDTLSLTLGGRAMSAFLVGEAPLYEMREESLQTTYGEGIFKLEWVWI
ncbi:hypothetical protein KAI87_06065, partial [Myxococcota bacterium]|nr:hypothetical protein [Myxococcota bacterium]